MTVIYYQRIILFLAFFSFSSISTYSQTASEIVSKYKTALQKNIDESSLKSLEVIGTFKVQNLNLPAKMYLKFPHLLRIEMVFQNMTFLQISNDSLKWEVNPAQNKSAVTPVIRNSEGSEAKNSGIDFVNPDLLYYKERNHRLKLIRKEKSDSLDVYVLELTKTDNKKSKILINTRTNLIYKIEDNKGYHFFANYKVNNGYVFPTYIKELRSDEEIAMTFPVFEFNKTLPDSLFLIPKEALDNRKINQKSLNRLLKKADSLYHVEEYELAIERYTKVISLDANNFQAFNGRGLSKLGRKEYYEAIVDFTKALELFPQAFTAHNNMGLSKYYLGDHAGAIKDYSKALELNPNYVVTLKNRGLVYIEDKKYDLAVQDFSSAAKLQPEDGVIYLKLGIALAELEKYDEALAAYKLALQNNYSQDDLFNYKGVSEYKLQKYDTASISFKKAVAMNPEYLQYIENCGMALYWSGAHQEALEYFEKYLQKKNDNPSIYNMTGLCKYRDEDYKGAIKDFSKSIELNSKEATYYDNRASAREELEDYEGAISDYNESIRLYPNDANVFYKRGLIKLATSKKIEGCLDLATANEMKYEPAKEAIIKNCN